MTTSLNGWPGIPTEGPSLATGTIPGTTKKVTLQKDVLPLFLAYLADWHKTVHPIEYPGSRGPDGWAYRAARTGAGLSNHASGTAVDVTYDWLRADHKRHMSPYQIQQVHALLDKYVTSHGKRIFGWGGDWTVGKFCDEMHTEIIQSWSPGSQGHDGTLADVRDVIARLHIQPDGTVAVPVLSVVKVSDLQGLRALLPSTSARLVNQALVKEGYLPANLARSFFGPRAQAEFRRWRADHGFGTDTHAALVALGAIYHWTVI